MQGFGVRLKFIHRNEMKNEGNHTMNALNSFLIANVALSALAMVGFYSLRVADASSEEQYDIQQSLAGVSGITMSVALLSVVGRMFI
jgi:hypothetical protein